MTAKRTFRRALLLSLTVSPFLVTFDTSISSSTSQTRTGECRVTISGSDEPELLPAHNVWESVFERATTEVRAHNALRLGPDAAGRMQTIGSAALQRVRALRESLVTAPTPGALPQLNHDRDRVVTETILDARDDAVRELSQAEFRELQSQIADLSRDLVVTLPVPGHVAVLAGGEPWCEVTISGSEFPHLIPEYRAWEVFFTLLAIGAKGNRLEDGTFDPAYLVPAGRSFRMGRADTIRLLEVGLIAADAISRVKETAPSTEEERRQLDRDIQRVVLEQRHAVLRRLSRDGWRALTNYIDEHRGGFTRWHRSRTSG